MTRHPVKSSNVKAIGHDPARNAVEIEFHSGAVHEYSPVTVQEHAALKSAPSVGKAVHAMIKRLGPGKKIK